jgi:hypothetical protein
MDTDSSRMEPDIGAEIESWLERDIPGHIEYMIRIASRAERGRGWSWRNGISVPSSSCSWWIAQRVATVTPGQLREIADEHDAVAERLSQDATELREYADDLEQPTVLGAAILEHFTTMGDEEAHQTALEQEQRQIAEGVGGVGRWEAVSRGTRDALRWGGYLRVDDVREALYGGALLKVKGIGPARIVEIARAVGGVIA